MVLKNGFDQVVCLTFIRNRPGHEALKLIGCNQFIQTTICAYPNETLMVFINTPDDVIAEAVLFIRMVLEALKRIGFRQV